MTRNDPSPMRVMGVHHRERLMLLVTVGWLAVACASSPSSAGPASRAAALSTISPSQVAPATASPNSTPEPTSPPPSAVPSAAGSPLPGDAGVAAALVDRYESALVNAAWPTAWSLLGPEAQAERGSLGAFESERAAFFASVRGRYVVGEARHDLGELTGWLPAGAPASANLGRSFLVQVDFPALSGNNAGWELFMAAPDVAGEWRLWQLR